MVEYRYRWVRTKVRGFADESNVKRREAEGWELVPDDELPAKPVEAEPIGARLWKVPEGLRPWQPGEQGGLRLYRMPEETARQRDAYYAEIAAVASAKIDNHYMRVQFKTVPTIHEPIKDVQAYIDNFPTKPTEDECEQAQCFIEDFLIYGVEQQPERRGQIDAIRALIGKPPYPAAAWAAFLDRPKVAENDYALQATDRRWAFEALNAAARAAWLA